MFSFRLLSDVSFARAAAKRTGYLAAASWLFAPVAFILLKVMPGALAFALGFILVIWIKPAIYAVFVLSFLGILVGRARATGVPVILVIGTLMLFMADWMFGFTLGFPGSNSFVAWLGWGMRTPPFFLTAMAVVGTLCVARGGDVAAADSWQTRLGGLSTQAMAVAAILLFAATWGALSAVGIYNPGLRALTAPVLHWPFIGRSMYIVAALGPLLLLPIALSEWRKAGKPGRHSVWFNAVAVAVVCMCMAGAVKAGLDLAHWIASRGALRTFDLAMAVPLKLLSLIGFLAALSLPALIARMLEDSSPPVADNPIPSAPRDSGGRARPIMGPRAAPTFGRRAQRI